ncbi:MAG: HPr kinase/phosphatase C-terminal domain-containing protein [Siculibacillus sp.]
MPDRFRPGAPSPQGTVHATAVAIGARAVLLRGPSGTGKSRIAGDLIADARARGEFATLIGDDRVRLEAYGGRLVARAVPELAGMIELRGVGIVATAHDDAAVVALVIDLVSEPPDRLPEEADRFDTIEGIRLARLPLWRNDPSPIVRVRAALAAALTVSRGNHERTHILT